MKNWINTSKVNWETNDGIRQYLCKNPPIGTSRRNTHHHRNLNIKDKLEEAKQAAETIADDVIKAQLEYLRDHPNIGELDDPNAIPGEWPLQYDEDNPGQGRCMHSQHELHYHPSQFPKSKEPQGNHDPTQPG